MGVEKGGVSLCTKITPQAGIPKWHRVSRNQSSIKAKDDKNFKNQRLKAIRGEFIKQTNKSLAKSQNRPALGSPPVSLPGHHHSLTQWQFLEVIVPAEPQEKSYPQSIG